MGKKDLTSRQQMEILSYALERAEDNIKKSVDALENERKRIEIFKVDTEGIEKSYKDASEQFDKLSGKRIAEMKEMHEKRPKWLQAKDWLLVGSLALLFVISAGYSVRSYWGSVSIFHKCYSKSFYTIINQINERFSCVIKNNRKREQFVQENSLIISTLGCI